MIATPAKLRDGSWGARVQGTAQVGDVITVAAKSGKSWQATVQRVLWTGEGVTLVATQTARRPKRVQDHEDCLSVGPCGPHCDYAHLFRKWK